MLTGPNKAILPSKAKEFKVCLKPAGTSKGYVLTCRLPPKAHQLVQDGFRRFLRGLSAEAAGPQIALWTQPIHGCQKKICVQPQFHHSEGHSTPRGCIASYSAYGLPIFRVAHFGLSSVTLQSLLPYTALPHGRNLMPLQLLPAVCLASNTEGVFIPCHPRCPMDRHQCCRVITSLSRGTGSLAAGLLRMGRTCFT